MFTKQTSLTPELDLALAKAYLELTTHVVDSDEYAKAADQIVKLEAIRTANRPDRISKDTMVLAGANLIGILTIVNHERAHVIASKALGFVKTLK